jgi:hypothetical protein
LDADQGVRSKLFDLTAKCGFTKSPPHCPHRDAGLRRGLLMSRPTSQRGCQHPIGSMTAPTAGPYRVIHRSTIAS